MPTGTKVIQFCLLCAIAWKGLESRAQASFTATNPVTQVAAGNGFSLFLESDGSLWAMGYDVFGQLGDGTNQTAERLPELIVASNVVAIAAGGYGYPPSGPVYSHSLFLKSDGSLWGMGYNSYGELGDGTYSNTNRPEMIVSSNVVAIAAGGQHSLFLKDDGSLWAMGGNFAGQLGDGTFNNTNQAEMIVASNVTAIAAGWYHSLFLKNDGSLWGMGYNFQGELGDGSYSNTNRPEMIVFSNVIAIAAGGAHTLFLKTDGSLWGMGQNNWGQLGDGTDNNTNQPEQIMVNNVTAIAAGLSLNSFFIKRDGSLWGTGKNVQHQLGDGTANSRNVSEEIVSNGVVAIATGLIHTLFIKNDGSLWGMGDVGYGELGYQINASLPIKVIAGPVGYNQVFAQLLGSGDVSLSYWGMAKTNYELDHSFSLSPANWIPQATNAADSNGALIFTNTPDSTTNNFWRIRSVP